MKKVSCLRTVKLNPERCLVCESCLLACALGHSGLNDINDAPDSAAKPVPRLRIKVKGDRPQIVRCRHCKKPKCMDACETGAIYKKDGYIVIDSRRCDRCMKCADACPYRAIFRDGASGMPVKCDSCGAEFDLAELIVN